MEGSCSAAIYNCGSWHGKGPAAVISGTTVDGKKTTFRARFEDERCLRGEPGAGTAGLCVYNAGLQMCKWKVGSLCPKAQDMELLRHLLHGLLDNTSESKPRDPNCPHCVMEAQPASPDPSAKGRDRASASLWPEGRPQEPGTWSKCWEDSTASSRFQLFPTTQCSQVA